MLTTIKVFTYSPDQYTERDLKHISELTAGEAGKEITWLDIDGLDDSSVVTTVGERFGLHSLLLEDVLNTDHRPKVEEYQDHLFVVAKMLSLDEETDGIVSEQISLVLGKGYVITFQEKPGDVLDPIRRAHPPEDRPCAEDGRGLPALRPARRDRGQLLPDRGGPGRADRGTGTQDQHPPQ
ncbi:MAG: hypothetical protein IPI07_17475 [Flavobacteriales bacterium]|nr:hypothetical protein [Flavobacteriales bacterium]